MLKAFLMNIIKTKFKKKDLQMTTKVGGHGIQCLANSFAAVSLGTVGLVIGFSAELRNHKNETP